MPVPFAHNEPARLDALHRFGIMDTPAEEVFDNFVRLAAKICGTTTAAISLVDVNRFWLKAKIGTNITGGPRDEALCASAILQTDLFVVEDTATVPRFANMACLVGPPPIRFYAAAPLITEDGFVIGTLWVSEPQPRTLTTAQREAMQLVARMVVNHMEQRRQLEEKESTRDTETGEELPHSQAYYDSLTGLPGRLIYEDRVSVAIAQAQRSFRMAAVALLDVDEFLRSIDTLSQFAADRLLQSVATRLKATLRKSDTVARLNGSTFALLLSNLRDGSDARRVCQKIMAVFDSPWPFGTHEVLVAAHLGVSLWPDDGDSVEVLLSRAGRALARARETGPNSFVIHDVMDDLPEATRTRMAGPPLELPTANSGGLRALPKG